MLRAIEFIINRSISDENRADTTCVAQQIIICTQKGVLSSATIDALAEAARFFRRHRTTYCLKDHCQFSKSSPRAGKLFHK